MHNKCMINAMSTSIDLKRLQHWVLLADELNFSRAAERANLSQTAFSRSIQALESELGTRLFDRDTRSVQETAVGRHLITRARDVLARAHDLGRDAHDMAHAQGGELSFGASLMAVNGVLHGILPQLHQHSPRLKLNVEVSQWLMLLQHLEQQTIEFFVAYPGTLAYDPRFTVTALPPERASVYCRADHPLLTQATTPTPSQLPNYPWAAIQLSDTLAVGLRKLFNMPPGSTLPLALSCDNLALLRETTLASNTLLLSWSSWVHADLQAGVLIDLGALLEPSLPKQAMQMECAIVQLAGRTPSPAAQRLMALIMASASTKLAQRR